MPCLLNAEAERTHVVLHHVLEQQPRVWRQVVFAVPSVTLSQTSKRPCFDHHVSREGDGSIREARYRIGGFLPQTVFAEVLLQGQSEGHGARTNLNAVVLRGRP